MHRASGTFRQLVDVVHPLLLSFPIALFVAALVTDITYLNTAHVQWTNFSSWLIAGALVGGGAVIVCAILALFLDTQRSWRFYLSYIAIVVVMWVVGLINEFQHSRDAWSSVGTAGLVMSIATALLAIVAGIMLLSRLSSRETDQ